MAPDYPTLYRFEELISATLSGLFNDASLVPKTVNDAAQFQSLRPRVDVWMSAGTRFNDHYVVDADNNRRENGWSGGFTLTVITPPGDFKIHSAYVAAVRNLAATLDWIDLTTVTVPLLYHEISQIRTTGTNSIVLPEAGEFHSNLHYDFIFAIRADAWPGGLTTA